MDQPTSLIARLRHCADLWIGAEVGRTPARLGRLVVNDNGFFKRIDSSGVTTTQTLERFARFLRDRAGCCHRFLPYRHR